MPANNKSTATHLESSPAESLEDSPVSDKVFAGDVGLHVFKSNIHAVAEEIDPHAEKRLVRKIDCFIIPLICITYLTTYIDKATLSYAALFGMTKDLHLHGTQYSWLGSIFYFGYMFFEYPTSFAMQKLSVAKWLSVNVFIWGGICMALGGCHSFSTLAALRFILGMLESCSTPAYLLLTAMWYTVDEQPIRIGYWSTFLGLANAFGGLLAYGIGHIHGGLEPWRYQYIIVDTFSSAWGIVLYFTLAENGTNARWLSTTLLDPKTWFLFLFGLSTQVVNGSVSNFRALIVKGFGYSKLVTTLLQIAYGMIILVAVLSAMYIQRWLPGQKRCVVAILYVVPALAGVVGIHVLPPDNRHGLLACYYLTAFYTASFAMCMSLITANTAGSTKRTTMNTIFFISYCVGNIVGPFAFKSSEAPRYPSGIVAIMVAYCVEIVVLGLFALYLAFQNKLKDKKAAEMHLEEKSEEEKALTGLTDIDYPFFRYTY